MAAISGFIGVLAVVLGLNGSLTWDTPAGPSIVVAALGCFVISILPFQILRVSIFKQPTKSAVDGKIVGTDEKRKRKFQ
jgi:hypothetical protein